MSEYSSKCQILRDNLKQCRACNYNIFVVEAIVKIFYEMVSCESWTSEEVIEMLESSKNISSIIDTVLNNYIEKESVYI